MAGRVQSKVQSVAFPKESWTLAQAREWLKAHGFRYGMHDDTGTFLRFRQHDPKDYSSFGTLPQETDFRGKVRPFSFIIGGTKGEIAKAANPSTRPMKARRTPYAPFDGKPIKNCARCGALHVQRQCPSCALRRRASKHSITVDEFDQGMDREAAKLGPILRPNGHKPGYPCSRCGAKVKAANPRNAYIPDKATAALVAKSKRAWAAKVEAQAKRDPRPDARAYLLGLAAQEREEAAAWDARKPNPPAHEAGCGCVVCWRSKRQKARSLPALPSALAPKASPAAKRKKKATTGRKRNAGRPQAACKASRKRVDAAQIRADREYDAAMAERDRRLDAEARWAAEMWERGAQ